MEPLDQSESSETTTEPVSVRDEIYEDLYRFSKLRGWFRSLPLSGRSYLLFPWRGQQPRNPFKPGVDDRYGLHWWIWEADYIDEIPIDGIGKDIIMRRPVKLNCFLRGLDGEPQRTYLQGWEVIKIKYPNIMRKLNKRHSKSHITPEEYADKQHRKQLRKATDMAMEIYTLMQEQCPEWVEVPVLRRTKSDYITFRAHTEIDTGDSDDDSLERPAMERKKSRHRIHMHSFSDKLPRKRKNSRGTRRHGERRGSM
jgi:hypothetical protein